jgi:hypothetical protein
VGQEQPRICRHFHRDEKILARRQLQEGHPLSGHLQQGDDAVHHQKTGDDTQGHRNDTGQEAATQLLQMLHQAHLDLVGKLRIWHPRRLRCCRSLLRGLGLRGKGHGPTGNETFPAILALPHP